MWDVISGDFDHKVSMDKCVRNVTDNAVPGSIIVFHDSRKAMEKMAYALPRVIEYFRDEGYSFGIIPQDIKPPSVR
jgi:peptidoglycan/xylan/chitin deacetylase (PgdA/CDA1 family)